MNGKVVILSVLAIVAVALLWAYSFGPLSGSIINKANPASFQPIPQQSAVSSKEVAFNLFNNKDLKENFYSIKFPQAWKLQAGGNAGSYHFVFDGGSGSSELQDVADNTTLELFVLSQEEPILKKSVSGYKQIGYQKISVNGNDAYELVYSGAINGVSYETLKVYVVGKDHAGSITLTAKQSVFSGIQPLFESIVKSFQWENK